MLVSTVSLSFALTACAASTSASATQTGTSSKAPAGQTSSKANQSDSTATTAAGSHKGGTGASAKGTNPASPTTQTPPTPAPVGYESGVQAFGKRDYQTAIADESKAIAANPKYYPAYAVKGIALCFAGSFTAGMNTINESLKIQPNYGYGLFNKALGLELYGYYDQAIATYKQAIPLGNGQWWKAWSYYGIAAVYGRRGDVPHVVEYLKQAEALSVNTKIAARTEKDFNPVRWSPAFQALLK